MTHPVQASRLGDLSMDYLVDHKIARLLQPEGSPLYDRFLVRRLEEVHDLGSLLMVLRQVTGAVAALKRSAARALEQAAALLSDSSGLSGWQHAVEDLLREDIGNAAHDPLQPLEVQLSTGAEMLRAALALASHAPRLLAGHGEVALPAPLLVRPEVPRDGPGPIEIIEVGDLDDYGSARGHSRARASLRDLANSVSWRWVHGPTGDNEQSLTAAAYAEIALAADPARFWEAIGLLYRGYALGETGLVREVAGVPERSVDSLKLALEDRWQEGVRRDAAVVDVCAVPPVRPAFVIGTKPFLGQGAVEALRAEVERLAKG